MSNTPTPPHIPWATKNRPARRAFPRSVARRILARDPDCGLAYPGICTGASEEADHVIPHSIAVQLGWELDEIDHPDNGQGVCRACHQRKTARESALARRHAALQRQAKQRPQRRHPGLEP